MCMFLGRLQVVVSIPSYDMSQLGPEIECESTLYYGSAEPCPVNRVRNCPDLHVDICV